MFCRTISLQFTHPFRISTRIVSRGNDGRFLLQVPFCYRHFLNMLCACEAGMYTSSICFSIFQCMVAMKEVAGASFVTVIDDAC